MAKGAISALTDEQLADYETLGFLHSIPILSPAEVCKYRTQTEATCKAIGDHVTRLDQAHLFFRWAWELSTHPRLLDFMEQLLGPNILLKSTRLFYKYGRSASYVGWHQDGITEKLEDAQVPAVWLGLTAATVANGCLRVAPGSHRLGLVPHVNRPDADNLTTQGLTAEARIESPYDVTMSAGEMSLHHPLILHSSNPNRSAEPRIGFTATYCTASLPASRTAVAWVRGDGPRDRFEIIDRPPYTSLEDAVAAYRARDHQILFGTSDQEACHAENPPQPATRQLGTSVTHKTNLDALTSY